LFGAFALMAVLATALVAAGCGDDDDETAAAETDGAFIAEMTTHHEAAIEMAEIAQERAQHKEVRELADAIVATQGEEIQAIGAMHERMFGEPLHEADHGTLGMAAHEMGMDMEPMHLEDAKPFDRAFIDAMIPHHQGAIRMARVELERGEDPELQDLAEAIIDAQSGEIEEMNAWRERWYGAPSPAGGVPSADETEAPSHEEMGH
jgi:uncharacterized protein (DUF305 family)